MDIKYWTYIGRNGSSSGIRQWVAVSQVIAENLSENSTFIAHLFLPSGEDNDTDGILDWFELLSIWTFKSWSE